MKNQRCKASDTKKLIVGLKIYWSPKPTILEPFEDLTECVITEVFKDHAIAEDINVLNIPDYKHMHLWIDEDTIDQFLLERT